MLIFCLFFGFAIVTILYQIYDWWLAVTSPMQKAHATVVTKRTSVSSHGHHDANHFYHQHHSTHYFCTFEFRDGRRIELKIGGRDFGQLADGDEGIVQFQHNRFRDFQRFP
jgi:hypothetical protein